MGRNLAWTYPCDNSNIDCMVFPGLVGRLLGLQICRMGIPQGRSFLVYRDDWSVIYLAWNL